MSLHRLKSIGPFEAAEETPPGSRSPRAWDAGVGHATPASDAQRKLFAARPGSRQLSRLRAVVLLGGSVRPTALEAAVGRSVLDLPIEEGRMVMHEWRSQAIALARYLPVGPLHVRLMMHRSAAEPAMPVADEHIVAAVERDPVSFRGTAGVLRDIAEGYDDDDFLLVANAAQLLEEPLPLLAAALAVTEADLSLISHEDGTPSGLMLVRCKCLRGIKAVGFVDMKEQALPAIAMQHTVAVVARKKPTGLPIRGLSQYVYALRQRHRRLAGDREGADPYAEEWDPAFRLVEPGEGVHPKARIHDSVILGGAVVGAGAVVIRSVVCPGAAIPAGKMIADELVINPGRRSLGFWGKGGVLSRGPEGARRTR